MNEALATWAALAVQRCIERARAMAATEFARLAEGLRK